MVIKHGAAFTNKLNKNSQKQMICILTIVSIKLRWRGACMKSIRENLPVVNHTQYMYTGLPFSLLLGKPEGAQ